MPLPSNPAPCSQPGQARPRTARYAELPLTENNYNKKKLLKPEVLAPALGCHLLHSGAPSEEKPDPSSAAPAHLTAHPATLRRSLLGRPVPRETPHRPPAAPDAPRSAQLSSPGSGPRGRAAPGRCFCRRGRGGAPAAPCRADGGEKCR